MWQSLKWQAATEKWQLPLDGLVITHPSTSALRCLCLFLETLVQGFDRWATIYPLNPTDSCQRGSRWTNTPAVTLGTDPRGQKAHRNRIQHIRTTQRNCHNCGISCQLLWRSVNLITQIMQSTALVATVCLPASFFSSFFFLFLFGLALISKYLGGYTEPQTFA